MDEPQALSQRIGLTRAKGAIVAVLAVILIVVIYVKYGPSRAADYSAGFAGPAYSRRAPKSQRTLPDATQESGNQPPATAVSSLGVSLDESRWKSPDLATVLAYDPFALPPSFPQSPQATANAHPPEEGATVALEAGADEMAEVIEALRMELEQLQQRGVHVIVRGRDEYVAMIGDRTVHVGDEISGFTVTAIEPDHVRVERKVQK